MSPKHSKTRLVLMSLLAMGACIATAALAESASWDYITRARLMSMRVGQEVPQYLPNKCCEYGRFITCVDNQVFACTTGTPVCNAGQNVDGTCTNAACNDELTLRCNTTNGISLHVDRCTLTGLTTGQYCPPGQLACQRNWTPRTDPLAPTSLFWGCISGSYECTGFQPDVPCDF